MPLRPIIQYGKDDIETGYGKPPNRAVPEKFSEAPRPRKIIPTRKGEVGRKLWRGPFAGSDQSCGPGDGAADRDLGETQRFRDPCLWMAGWR